MRCLALLLLLLLAPLPMEAAVPAQDRDAPTQRRQRQRNRAEAQARARAEADARRAEAAARRADAVARGVEILLEMQEGQGASEQSEWPYEGVYRVRGTIPIGYRVGGTSICVMALLEAPGYESDTPRQNAVRRAVEFVCAAADEPLMSATEYDGGYDVRGWGYCYALQMLLALRAAEAVPEGMESTVDDHIRHYLGALEAIEIPTIGGWNYARSRGRDAVSPCSPFMTAPALRALYEARRQGFDVDPEVVERALTALERCRTRSGAFAYSATGNGAARRDLTPGAVGRMVASESALRLAGRSNPVQLRGAIDAFLAHWDALEARRQQNGTHVPPYGVAPYYFFYAHLYAAEAIELLPEYERGPYRRALEELLFKVQEENGAWNDRVFARSANYGTAMSMLALTARDRQDPATWPADDAAPSDDSPQE